MDSTAVQKEINGCSGKQSVLAKIGLGHCWLSLSLEGHCVRASWPLQSLLLSASCTEARP